MSRIAKTLSCFTFALLSTGVLFASLGRVGAMRTREVPVDSLIYDLKNPDAKRRKDAVTALGKKKVTSAVPDLVAMTGDGSTPVRKELVVALDKIGDPRALPAFVTLSEDRDKTIRDKSLDGIVNLYLSKDKGFTGGVTRVANFLNPWSDEWGAVAIDREAKVDESAIGALSARLQDSDNTLRVKSARALGILRGQPAVPVMLDSLRHDRNNGVRFEIVRSFRKIGDASVAPELMNYLEYGDPKVRNESIYTIGRLRYRPAAAELQRLYEKEASGSVGKVNKDHQRNLMDAMAFIGDPSSKELFLKEKRNPDNVLRLRAVEGLARIADNAEVTDVSRDRLREKDAKVQVALAYALYRMGRTEYLEAVVEGLDDGKTRAQVTQYLVEFPPGDLPKLTSQARHNSVSVRESIAQVLGEIGDSSSIPALQDLSKDTRGNIAPLSVHAMRRINNRSSNP